MSSLVGALQLPVPAGAALSELTDPTLMALLQYLAHWIRSDLGAKAAVLTPTSADPCPSTNLFPWEPEGTFVRSAIPALYAWHASAASESQKYSTIAYPAIEREINVLYIFEELQKPDGFRARHGIYKAIGDIFAKASDRGRHDTFSYNGDPTGAPLYLSAGFLEWRLISGQPGWLDSTPGGGSRQGGSGMDRHAQRGYPAYNARFLVVERVGGDVPDDEDALIDASLSIDASDGGDEVTHIMDRELEGPDGGDE